MRTATQSVIATTDAMREASLTAKLSGAQHRDHRFLPLFGEDRDLECSFPDIENRIRRVALREEDLILSAPDDGRPVRVSEQETWIK
jgi:hypothetical protein